MSESATSSRPVTAFVLTWCVNSARTYACDKRLIRHTRVTPRLAYHWRASCRMHKSRVDPAQRRTAHPVLPPISTLLATISHRPTEALPYYSCAPPTDQAAPSPPQRRPPDIPPPHQMYRSAPRQERPVQNWYHPAQYRRQEEVADLTPTDSSVGSIADVQVKSSASSFDNLLSAAARVEHSEDPDERAERARERRASRMATRRRGVVTPDAEAESEEVSRAAMRRLQNRASVQKCRRKQRERVQRLEYERDALSAENAVLHDTLRRATALRVIELCDEIAAGADLVDAVDRWAEAQERGVADHAERQL